MTPRTHDRLGIVARGAAWLVALSLLTSVNVSTSAGFARVGTLRGQGGLVASAVAPGPDPGSERLYASFMYFGDTIEVLSIDLESAAFVAFRNPAAGEYGARCMVAGPDGNVYLGTLPTAHLLRLDPRSGTLSDLGRPSKTEEYIWDLAVGGDGRIYGATYPSAKLVRLDPRSGRMEDLGRMDDAEMYAHYLAPGEDGFVYVGIGTRRMDIVAYEIATGRHRGLLSEADRNVGQAVVYVGTDGKRYGAAGQRHYRLEGGAAIPIEGSKAAPVRPAARTRGGQVLTLVGSALLRRDPATGASSSTPFAYGGRPLPLFRVGLGPDGKLYGSSVLPARLVRLDEQAGEFTTLGDLGPGEAYSFLSGGGRLHIGVYASATPLLSFDPAVPFSAGSARPNPAPVTFAGGATSWRPVAMAWGPDGRAYAAATAPYGRLDGQVIAWDVAKGVVDSIAGLPPDQGFTALTVVPQGLVIGTTILGGGGTEPSAREARLLLADPKTRAVTRSLVPVAGAPTIENLAATAAGRIVGIAGGKLFTVDPVTWKVTRTTAAGWRGSTLFGSLEADEVGRLWGLVGGPSGGVVSVDPETLEASYFGPAPRPVTGGYGIRGRELFFVSGAELWRFQLPQLRGP